MCGYIGIVWKDGILRDSTRPALERVEPFLKHRGPDESGYYENEGFGVLHRRLSIIDIFNGHQPLRNATGNVGCAYNGEIYNHRTLRQGLESRGVSFDTNCDTEVLLKLFELEGVDTFNQLDGMFTAFIWDLRGREPLFYLVRDHMGVKPLYVYEDGEKFAFSSELYPLLRMQGVDDAVDPRGIASYLSYRYCHSPITMFSRIRRVEAGTYVLIRNARSTSWRYWDLPTSSSDIPESVEEASDHLRSLLLNSVRKQQMSEVPVGLLLSGGLDSSAIAALCAQAGVSLMSFNIGFPELNEFVYSNDVAQRFGLPHLTVETTPADIGAHFKEVVRAMDEPIADPACFPLYLLCRRIKQDVTVILSGEGSDEMLAGYPQYQHTLNANVDVDELKEVFLQHSWYFSNAGRYVSCGAQGNHLIFHDKYLQNVSLLNGMLAFDLKTWLPENLMAKADKITMAHSLEGRFPFLSRDVVEFVLPLPKRFKLGNGDGKRILREAFAADLPESVLSRPKMGFSVPTDDILKANRQHVRHVVDGLRQRPISEVLNLSVIADDFNRYFEQGTPSGLQMWTLYVLLEWFDRYYSETAA